MTSVTSEGEGQSWHFLSKSLLYRKAAFTFLAMAKQKCAEMKFLDAFKLLKMTFYSFSK